MANGWHGSRPMNTASCRCGCRRSGYYYARVVTADKSRGIQSYGWAYDSKTIIYAQDAAGDENFHLFAVDLDLHNVRDLTPWQGVRAESVASSSKFPERMLVALNLRNRKLIDVDPVDLPTGAVELDTKNPGDVAGWLADDNMIVRAATITTPDGGTEIRIRDSAAGPWRFADESRAGRQPRRSWISPRTGSHFF